MFDTGQCRSLAQRQLKSHAQRTFVVRNMTASKSHRTIRTMVPPTAVTYGDVAGKDGLYPQARGLPAALVLTAPSSPLEARIVTPRTLCKGAWNRAQPGVSEGELYCTVVYTEPTNGATVQSNHFSQRDGNRNRRATNRAQDKKSPTRSRLLNSS
jgi:hypothetical protein